MRTRSNTTLIRPRALALLVPLALTLGQSSLALAAQGPELATERAAPDLPNGPIERDEAAKLEYLSDFFVFAGREASSDGKPGKGLVFAFDANRGREKQKYAAEHFAVLWVEGRGWVDLDVTQSLPGAAAQFARAVGVGLPTCERAQVAGDAFAGLTIEVPKVALKLVAEPIGVETDRRNGGDVFLTGATKGRLTLGERAFVGVVHHEFTYLVGVNPLAKTYTDLFGEGFHSVYALLGAKDALRLHRTGGTLEPLIGRHSGYLVRDGAEAGAGELPAFKLETAKKSLGGLFRWPGRYDIGWREGAADARRRIEVKVDLKDRETLINYVFGGVAIAIASGELVDGAQREPVLGFTLIVL
ncbi:MAG: hypothetical protein R3F49_21215 [Planctomycetota bacterium]